VRYMHSRSTPRAESWPPLPPAPPPPARPGRVTSRLLYAAPSHFWAITGEGVAREVHAQQQHRVLAPAPPGPAAPCRTREWMSIMTAIVHGFGMQQQVTWCASLAAIDHTVFGLLYVEAEDGDAEGNHGGLGVFGPRVIMMHIRRLNAAYRRCASSPKDDRVMISHRAWASSR
jgi:hypothetical protein